MSTSAAATVAAGLGLTVGSTPISGGTSGKVLYDNAGVLGEQAAGASGGGKNANNFRLSASSTGAQPEAVVDESNGIYIYMVPFNGTSISLYDGSNWNTLTPPYLSYSVSGSSDKVYDLFCFTSSATPSSTNTSTDVLTFASTTGWNTGAWVTVAMTGGGLTAGTDYWWRAASSTTGTLHPTANDAINNTNKVDLTASITASLTAVALATASAWTNYTTRADAVATQDGIRVLSSDHTRRLVGTFYTSAGTSTADAPGGRWLRNEDNPVPRSLRAAPAYNNDNALTSYTTTSTTYTEANGGTGSKAQFLSDGKRATSALLCGFAAPGSGGGCYTGLGVDSTSSPVRVTFHPTPAAGVTSQGVAGWADTLAEGYHYLDLLITVGGGGGTAATYYADALRYGASADPYGTMIEGTVWT